MNEEKVLDDVPAQKRNWKLILIAAVGAVLALTVVVWIAWPKSELNSEQMSKLRSHQFSFKESLNEDARKAKNASFFNKFKDFVPVIVEKASFISAPILTKKTYVCNKGLTVNQINEQICHEKTLSFYVNGRLLNDNELISKVYELNKDEDGFLYLVYV